MVDRQDKHKKQKQERAFTKGTWTKAEDEQLMEIVRVMGPKRWSSIAEKLEGRIGKQCRERWYNHLDPNVKKEWWTPEEDHVIIEHHERHGNQWSQIAKKLTGRPANAIKNHWNSTLKRVVHRAKDGLVKSGIYPVTLPPCPKRKKMPDQAGVTIQVFLNINTPFVPAPSTKKKSSSKKYKKRTASQRNDPTDDVQSPPRKKLKRGRGRPTKMSPSHEEGPSSQTMPFKISDLHATLDLHQLGPLTSPPKNAALVDIFNTEDYINPSTSSQNFAPIADEQPYTNLQGNSFFGKEFGHSAHMNESRGHPLDSDELAPTNHMYDEPSFHNYGIDAELDNDLPPVVENTSIWTPEKADWGEHAADHAVSLHATTLHTNSFASAGASSELWEDH